MSCSRWHFVPSGVFVCVHCFPSPFPQEPMEIRFFKAVWAILGTLQLFMSCVLDISAVLLLYLYCLYF